MKAMVCCSDSDMMAENNLNDLETTLLIIMMEYFRNFVVLGCSLLSFTSYSLKLMKEPIFGKKLATYFLKTYIYIKCKPIMMGQFMFHELSTLGAKQCLVVLIRNVKNASYQLLLKEEMVPNARKQFG